MPQLVSILIPAYNAERWIGETVRSALAQTGEGYAQACRRVPVAEIRRRELAQYRVVARYIRLLQPDDRAALETGEMANWATGVICSLLMRTRES